MTLSDFILAGLNEKQKDAATAPDGPVLIIAGAGSGKTKALTHRVAYLIACGVSPEKILAVTFTNKAAGEMRNRIRILISHQLPVTSYQFPFIGTFHSFCASILRNEYAKIGYKKNFTIFDDDDSLSLLKEVAKDLNVSPKQYPPGLLANAISSLKTQLIGPERYAKEHGEEPFTKQLAVMYGEYQQRLEKANAVDFDDLIMKVILLFQKNHDVLATYQDRYLYIHVDEFQDTNMPQYLLIRLLAQKHKNVFVIGDDAQSIYSWRGADWRNIFSFENDWQDAKIIFLEQNYRSTETILQAANQVIGKNILQRKKDLWTEKKGGDRITLIATESGAEEAETIASEIEKIAAARQKKLSDIAVLYRTNAQSRQIEEMLLAHALPYRIIGGTKFFQRREVKDIVSYIRVLENRMDFVSLRRIANTPPRGIGNIAFLSYVSGMTPRGTREQAALAKFEAMMAGLRIDYENLPPSQLIKNILKKTNYRGYLDDGSVRAAERWENIQELVGFSTRFDADGPKVGVQRILEDAALLASDEHETPEEQEGKISLMTIHAAKGLEFPIVFITGMEEGVFPHAKAAIDPASLEEERRLCYVGITRAEEKLYLSYASRRILFGEMQANVPSRFLREIPKECMEMHLDENKESQDYEEEAFLIE